MEVGEQGADHTELESGIDEDVSFARAGADSRCPI